MASTRWQSTPITSKHLSQLVLQSYPHCLTVNPLESVVDCVVAAPEMGVAKPRLAGCTALRAARLRRAVLRLRASLRDAMTRGAKGRKRRRETTRTERRTLDEVEVRKTNCGRANHMTTGWQKSELCIM